MIAGLSGSLRRLLPVTALLYTAVITAQAAAQGPPVPPARDTLQVDTLPDPELIPQPDTVPPAERVIVRFPAMPQGPAAGFAGGEWVWDRDALLREAATSLTDLLDRIPFINTYRAGTFAQPEAATAFGGTAGRLEIELNGYVLDPLAAASLDLASIAIAHIREVRVQRRLGLLRIRILTDESTAHEPYTRVEAGIGQPRANLFRGVVLAPDVFVGPLGLAIERLDTHGPLGGEPSRLFSGWAKWAWTDGARGVQLEVMQAALEREPRSPWPIHQVRRDVVLRARSTLAAGLLAEVYAGRSAVVDSLFPPPQDTLAGRVRELTNTQAGARLVWDAGVASVQGRLRYRDAAFLPRIEAGIEAGGRVGPARALAELMHARWADADPTTYYALHAELGLPAGASIFAELSGGRRGAPPWQAGGPPVISERSGWRAGLSASVAGGRVSGSVALFGLRQDMAYPFGLPFDTGAAPTAAEDGRGVEAYGRLVLVPGWLALESSISEWLEGGGWIYLPARSWRTALESHAIPLASGNLEILGRLEAAHRGSVFVYAPARRGGDAPAFEVVPVALRVNGYLQIRIIDVRLFIRWEDLLGNTREIVDLPGRPIRGPRMFYGVKWHLWN